MNMGNMREISIEECRRVSGGLIVVNGYTGGGYLDFGYGGFGNKIPEGFLMQGIGIGLYDALKQVSDFLATLNLPVQEPNLVDTNDDGVPDSPEIVVVATVEQIEALKVAYSRAETDVGVGQVILAFIMGTRASTGGLSGGVQAAGQELTFSAIKQTLVDARAEYLYQQDKLDGVYDGVGPQDYERTPSRDPYL
jgi:hypothetical protein